MALRRLCIHNSWLAHHMKFIVNLFLQECDFTTSLKQLLKLHVSRVHREKQLECLDCGEKFGPLVDLKTHIKETG